MMSFRKFLLSSALSFWILFLSVPASAQPILQYSTYNSGREMAQSRTSCMLQDREGMLWFGTWIGLCRYDGEKFRYFRSLPGNENPQTSNRIIQLTEEGKGSEGRIWCVTSDQQIYRFDRTTSRFTDILSNIDMPKGYSFKSRKGARAIYPLNNGHTWVVLAQGGCLRFNNENLRDNEMWMLEDADRVRTIHAIQEDSQGREWILSNEGTRIYGQSGNVSDYPFTKMTEIDGRIFLSTPDGYLAEYADRQLRFINLSKSIKSLERVRSIGQHRLLLCASDGIAIFNTENDSIIYHSYSVDGQEIGRTIYAERDSRGRLWIFAASGEVYWLRLGDHQEVRRCVVDAPIVPSDTEEGDLHMIVEDAAGGLWIKPRNRHICWLDEKTMRLRPASECLPEGTTLDIDFYHDYFVDRQHNVWITGGESLYRLTMQPRRTRFYPLPLKEVRSIIAQDADHVLVGDREKGVVMRLSLSSGQSEYLTPEGRWSNRYAQISNTGAYAMLLDSDSVLWVGTRGDGLYNFAPTGERRHYIKGTSESDISDNNIFSLFEDERRHIWVGTYGGGLNLVDRRWEPQQRFIQSSNRLLSYPKENYLQIRSITGDRHGQILVGTTHGLLTFGSVFGRAAEIDFYVHECRPNDPNSLPDNSVMQVLCSPDRQTYVCTYGFGPSRALSDSLLQDSLRFQTLINKDFPAADISISAQLDARGRIWSISKCGLSVFDPESGKMQYFDANDYGKVYTFGEARPLLHASGELLIGAEGGLLAFHTDSMTKSDFVPTVVLTDVSTGSDGRSLKAHLAALDYQPLHTKRYAYKLEGVDEDWQYTSSSDIQYVNLPSGKHTLLVRSTNNQGVWCDNEARFPIHVPASKIAWWIWALIVGSAVVISIVYSYVREYIDEQKLKLQKVHKRRLDFERQKTQKEHWNAIAKEKEVARKQEEIAFLKSQLSETNEALLQSKTAYDICLAEIRHRQTRIEELSKEIEVQGQDSTTDNNTTDTHITSIPTTDSEDTERTEESNRLFIERLEKYLEENISNPDLDVVKLAECVNCSRTNFYRKLKQLTGLSPLDFIRSRRIERAKELIVSGEDTVAMIAYKVGFSDPKYFSKSFRQVVGCPPQEYKQRVNAERKRAQIPTE